MNEVDSATVAKIYSFNVVEGELTDAERAELPLSFQNACKDKPIQKTKRVVVDEATFNQDSFDGVGTRKRINPFFNLTSRQDSCNSQKVKVSKYKFSF